MGQVINLYLSHSEANLYGGGKDLKRNYHYGIIKPQRLVEYNIMPADRWAQV